MLEHGVSNPKDYVIDDRDRNTGRMDLEKYYQLPTDMPTAFVCNCDLAASYLIRKLEREGYRVPEDVSVVGFDNYLFPDCAILELQPMKWILRRWHAVSFTRS